MEKNLIYWTGISISKWRRIRFIELVTVVSERRGICFIELVSQYLNGEESDLLNWYLNIWMEKNPIYWTCNSGIWKKRNMFYWTGISMSEWRRIWFIELVSQYLNGEESDLLNWYLNIWMEKNPIYLTCNSGIWKERNMFYWTGISMSEWRRIRFIELVSQYLNGEESDLLNW